MLLSCSLVCRPAPAHRQQQQAAEERRRSGTAASTSGSSGSSSTSSRTGPTVASVAERLLHPSHGVHADPSRPSGNTAVDEQYKPFLDEWDRGFVEGREEPEGYWLECVQGAVPADLCGTLFRCAGRALAALGWAAPVRRPALLLLAAGVPCSLQRARMHRTEHCRRTDITLPLAPASHPRRNGPGKFKVGGQEVGHPYDGDGMIHSIAFKAGRAYCRSRFVQTAECAAAAACAGLRASGRGLRGVRGREGGLPGPPRACLPAPNRPARAGTWLRPRSSASCTGAPLPRSAPAARQPTSWTCEPPGAAARAREGRGRHACRQAAQRRRCPDSGGSGLSLQPTATVGSHRRPSRPPAAL